LLYTQKNLERYSLRVTPGTIWNLDEETEEGHDKPVNITGPRADI